MAGVENDESRLRRKNLMRLLDVFNFIALTSVVSTLLLAFIKENDSLAFFVNTLFSLLFVYLTIFDHVIWIFPAQLIFMAFVHVLYSCTTMSLAAMLLIIISSVWLALGFIGLSMFGTLLFWKRRFPGDGDCRFISAEIQLVMVDCLILFFINGYSVLLFSLFILQDGAACTLGFVLLGFLWFLSFFGCIYRLIFKWKEYHRAGATVSSIPSRASTIQAVA